MKRTIIIGAIQAVAMALALFWLFITMIGHMMEPSGGGIGGVLQACAIAIVLISVAVLVLLYLGRMKVAWLVASIAAMLAAAVVPEMVYSVNRQAYLAEKQAEERALEARVVAELDSRKRDVETHIAAKRSYTPEESLNFLFFVTGSDLSNRGLGDHSGSALTLLQHALQEKVVDPNGWVKGPRVADVTPEPLFLYYYKAWVRPVRRGPIDAMNWKVMRLLAENGADLTMPAAANLAEDLRKPERPGVSRRWIELD